MNESELTQEREVFKTKGVYFEKSGGEITHIQGRPVVHKGSEWGHEDRGSFRGNRHELIFPNLIPKQERVRIATERQLVVLETEVRDMEAFLFSQNVNVNKAVDTIAISRGSKSELERFHLLRELEAKKARLNELQRYAADVAEGWCMP